MIDYEEDWLLFLLLRKDGSGPLFHALYFALPSAVIGVLLLYLDEWFPGMREDLGLLDVGHSQIWNALVGVIVILLGFRTKQGLARFWEGTGLLHQMRGEWFDTVSNCVTFSISAKKKKPEEVKVFRHALVRLMSLAHGSALEEIAGDTVPLDSIDVFGLDSGTLRHLKECHEQYQFNKVEVMLHLVQSLITKAFDDGVLAIPPPILSRVYQTISRGFVNLLNAKKITDTRFPFPYAQLISFLLFGLTVLTPVMLSCHIKSKVLIAIFTYIPIFGMCSLNLISIELENPFGTDRNDLPLETFQGEMNKCLLMLLHTNTDLITEISPDCMTDFKALYREICPDNEHIARDHESPNTPLSRRKTRLSHFKDERKKSSITTDVDISANTKLSVFTQRSVQSTSDADAGTGKMGKTSSIVSGTNSTAPTDVTKSATATKSAESGNLLVGEGLLQLGGAKPVANVEVVTEPLLVSEVSGEPEKSEPERKGAQEADLQSVHLETKAEMQVESKMLKAKTPSTGPTSGASPRAPVSPPSAMPKPPRDLAVKETLETPRSAVSDLEPLLAKSTQDFTKAMALWTETIDKQVNELKRNCNVLKTFNDTLSVEVRASSQISGWEGSVPGV